MFCSTRRMVTPSSLIFVTVSSTFSTIIGASPSEGSSSMRSSGFAMRLLQMTSICCSPPLRVWARAFSFFLRTGKSW